MARIKIKNPKPFWAEVILTPFLGVQTPGIVNNLTEDSHIITRESSADYVGSYALNAEVNHPHFAVLTSESHVSSNESVATVNATGKVSVVSSGVATISSTYYDQFGNSATSDNQVSVSIETGITVDFIGHSATTLADSLGSDADILIDAASGVSACPRFSVKDFNGKSYTRNESFMLKGMNGLSSIAVWNSRQANRRGAIAITPRHILYAAHYPFYTGDVVSFVPDVVGAIAPVDRTLLQAKVDPLYKGQTELQAYDFGVALLDSDLPVNIDTVKILPSDYKSHAGQYQLLGVPMFFFNQDEEARTTYIGLELNHPYEGSTLSGHILTNQQASAMEFFPQRSNYDGINNPSDYFTQEVRANSTKVYELHKAVRVGDSGRQNFFVDGNDLILSFLHTAYNAGVNLSQQIGRINQLILDVDAQAGISTGHTVTEADLSSFPSF